MNLLKTFTLKWYQNAIFKIGMLSLGIVIGTYWHGFFGGYVSFLIVVAAVCLSYTTYLWWKQ
jgi:hypothetical protein